MRSSLAILCLTGALLAPPSAAPAQEAPSSSEAAAAFDAAAHESRRAELADLIAGLRAAPSGAAGERLALLERSERLLTQVLEEDARSDALAARLESARKALAVPEAEGLDHPPPFSIAEYDAAADAVQTGERTLAERVTASQTSKDALEAARTEAENVERAARSAAGDGDLAPLRVEAARFDLTLRRLQASNARTAEEIQRLELARARALLEWLATRVAPRADELDRRTAELDTKAAQLSRAREQAELRMQTARRRWESAAAAAEVPGVATSPNGEVAARRAELAARQKEVALLGEQIDRLERARELLQRRFEFFGASPPPRAELADWAEESRAARDSLAREAALDRAEQSALGQEIERVAGEPEGPWRDAQLAALRDAVAIYDQNLQSIDTALTSETRLLDGLDRELRSFDLMERLAELRAVVADVWGFEVTSSEDRSITIGRIATGLLGFLVGIVVARILTHWLGARVFSRMGFDEGAAAAYQALAYYALLAAAFLTALRMVDIPLTAFAVVGGALAIGVGFGSQNIVNNFISGLILLAERPIKKGDLVQLDETYGNVERIGLRSTRLRTGENIHVIVPNAAFLENRVINWTHTDPQVRIKVTVGIVYGAPTREAARIIGEVIEAHDKVQAKPAPVILFKAFGDNSLDFEAHFWVRIRNQMERMRIESDIRFSIDDRFREAGIVIAFPQRDVHLDAAHPIPIRLTGGRDPGGGET